MESATNPRPSRWSDGPTPPVAADPNSADKRPASSLPEPAFKKARPDDPPSLEQPSHAFTPNPNAIPNPSLVDASSFNGRSTSGFSAAFPTDASAYATLSQNSSFPGSFAPGSAKGSGTGALFYKTKLCTKFKLGSCTFNERCHFAHGVEDLRKPPPGWEELVKAGAGAGAGAGKVAEPARRSNKPCRYFMEGNCPYGERCTFSHGNEDTQRGEVPVVDGSSAGAGIGGGGATANINAATRPNYKTRICATWEKGEICSYGDRCHFAHGQADLRPYGGVPNYNVNTMTMPGMYSEHGSVNQVDPYGSVQVNYANTGGPPMSSMNTSAYPGMGGVVNSYGPVQGNTNGYPATTTYTYWNPDGLTSAAPTMSNQSYAQPNMVVPPSQNHVSPNATVPAQSYVQPMPAVVPNPSYAPQLNPPAPVNQSYMPATGAAPWLTNYPSDGGYAKNDNSSTHYVPDLSQQQNVQYYGGPPSYQVVNQNPPYAPPDGSQTNYQMGNKNGDVGAYYNAAATYTTQQTGYIGSYNAA